MPTQSRTLVLTLLAALTAPLLVIGIGALTPRSAAAVEGPVPIVFIARADVFADSLAAGPLASLVGAPLLFSETDALPEATIEELVRLQPGKIVILGGVDAVDADVEEALQEYAGPGGIERIGGVTRIETAALIARELPDQAFDAATLDGLDSSAFAAQAALDEVLAALEEIRADVGALQEEVAELREDVDAEPTDPPDGGGDAIDADTLDGLDSTDFVRSSVAQPFISQMDTGNDTMIGSNGPLEVAAFCERNGPNIQTQIRVRTSVDGAYTDDPPFSGFGGGALDIADGWANLMDQFALSAEGIGYSLDIDDGVAIAEQDGTLYVVSIDGETHGRGINIYGTDCLVHGIFNAYSMPVG